MRTGRRLLVVDDEEPILFALSSFFGGSGYTVDCARDVREAERLLNEGDYACVIADLRLSGSQSAEGLDILSIVRERGPKQTRFVMLTAYGSPEIECVARRRGADAFLHKPVALRELAHLLDELVAET